MSTKNVTLKEKVNGASGNVLFPATTTPNVYDSAKSQALSQTLVNAPDYEALGFAKFSTATAYNAGDKVYKDNGLYRFIADKTAGEWDVAKVEPWSIEQEIEEVDDAIRSLIPAQASEDNKLADKAYVNDKVSTDTATFRGTFNLVSDLELTTEATQGQIATALGTAISGEDKNDYAFVQIPTSDATPTEIARIDRYKYTGLQWAFEYSLNNSGFTAEQWAAINSGITSSLVTAFGAKYDKPAGGIPASDMNTSTFDDEPTAGSDNLVKSGGVAEEISKKLNILPSPSYEVGHFYYNGINKGDGVDWKCAIIPIDGVTHLLVKTSLYGNSNCCITDASDNVLVSWERADLVNNLIDVDLSQYPSASKLYFSVRQKGGFVFEDAFVYGTKPLASKDDVATIEEEISDINEEIYGIIPIDSELVAGLVTTSSAPNFVSGGSYRTTDFLPVNTGDKIVAKCAVGTSGYAITCYSSNTQSSYVAETGVVGVDGSTLNDYEINIPNGVNYIRVTTDSAITGFDGTIPITKYSNDGILPRIEKLEGEILGQTIILDKAVLINTKGGEQASGGKNYWSSDFIPVTSGQSLKINSLTGGSGALLVSFYTNNTQNSFAGHGLVGDGTLHKIVNIIVPNGVSYMRLCSSTGETGPHSADVFLNKDGERLLALENTVEYKTLLSFKRTSPRLPMVLFQMDMASAAYNPTILDYMNILSANGIKKSTYNVLPQFMGADAYKNFDVWMNEIYSKGNEIALHTDHSYAFNEDSSLTPEQIQAAMVDYLTRMKAKGYDVTGFIPLGANLKPSFKPIVQKFSSWMLSGTNADPADVNPLEPNVMDFICGLSTSLYAIKRVSLESMQDEYTEEKDAEILQVAKDVVDSTITNGGYVIFYAHTYNTTSGTTYTLRPGVLEPLCQYIKQKIDNMEIVTGNTNEMLEWYYTPRVGE